MNTDDACTRIRKAGIKMDKATMLAGIRQGALPFGTAVKCRKNWRYYINEQALDEWAKSYGSVAKQ